MYVGRIVVVGKTTQPFVAYRVSSRSFPNRVARITREGVAIQPVDPEEVKRNPYIAYHCIRIADGGVVVSNGTHTDPITEELDRGVAPETALQHVLTEMGYERDDFNTPRIAGIVAHDTGYLGIARVDAVEVTSFKLAEQCCRVICTYEKDRPEPTGYPFAASTAMQAARFVVEDGIFAQFELPICSAAWMGELAVYNPRNE